MLRRTFVVSLKTVRDMCSRIQSESGGRKLREEIFRKQAANWSKEDLLTIMRLISGTPMSRADPSRMFFNKQKLFSVLNYLKEVIRLQSAKGSSLDSNGVTPELTADMIVKLAEDISKVEGMGSEERKAFLLRETLSKYRLDEEDVDFVWKVLQDELKIGLSVETFENMLAQDIENGKLSEDDISAFESQLLGHFLPSKGRIYKPSNLPIKPMLARPVAEAGDIPPLFKTFGEKVLVEPKYDGERMLVDSIHHRFIGRGHRWLFIRDQETQEWQNITRLYQDLNQY